MIPVSDALDHLFALAAPLGAETVPLTGAMGRVLADTVHARRTQPPFAAASMDGYAVRAEDHHTGRVLTVVGEAAAGHPWTGTLGAGQALRIFTGAPVPASATHVVMQENTSRQPDHQADQVTLTALSDTPHIRAAGCDFAKGAPMAPRRLTAPDIALLAAMNLANIPVTRRPDVAIIATGDELVPPGAEPGPGQIIASNSYGLAAMIQAAGAAPRVLPIARDTLPSLAQAFDLAADADLIVTIGGASVGDHDLVAQATQDRGMDRAFYKIAMRPGKPLMAGRMGGAAVVGLPGNPVSAMVCGEIFLRPMIDRMLGLPAAPRQRQTAALAAPLPANGPREHYMRARIDDGGQVTAFSSQDSALLSVLSQANALLVRPPHAAAATTGAVVEVVPL